jgi:hypothetical protein
MDGRILVHPEDSRTPQAERVCPEGSCWPRDRRAGRIPR